ncbi:MAG: ChbG/HpnK family deacetylase, partial [Clostridia bacterium]
MKLIVNADDFGMSIGTNYGILQAMTRGIVTSTTMMVNGEAVDQAVELIKSYKLAVGLHINLSLGSPLTNAPTLIEKGEFIKPKNLIDNDARFDEGQLQREIQAQFDKFCDLTAKLPTHIDSHLYTHQKFPKVKEQVLQLADKYKLPVRQFGASIYDGVEFEGSFKLLKGESPQELQSKLFNILLKIQQSGKTTELMVHPAFVDRFLYAKSTY